MGLIDKIKARMELHRLEQRYTRRDQRSTYGAQYIDGEYVYNHNTGRTSNSSSSVGSSNSNSSSSYVPANGNGTSRISYMPANGTPFAANGTSQSNKRMSRLFA